jgi:hypothetical protein
MNIIISCLEYKFFWMLTLPCIEIFRVFKCGTVPSKALEARSLILNARLLAGFTTECMCTLLTGWASMSRGGRKVLANTEFQGSTVDIIPG